MMSLDFLRLHLVLLRKGGCSGGTGWLKARAEHLKTGWSLGDLWPLMGEMWVPPQDSKVAPEQPLLEWSAIAFSGHYANSSLY